MHCVWYRCTMTQIQTGTYMVHTCIFAGSDIYDICTLLLYTLYIIQVHIWHRQRAESSHQIVPSPPPDQTMRWPTMMQIETIKISWNSLEHSLLEFGTLMVSWISSLWLLFYSCPVNRVNRWPCHTLTDSVSHFLILSHTFTLKSNPRDLWPLRLVAFETLIKEPDFVTIFVTY